MILHIYTTVHVLISLVAIFTGGGVLLEGNKHLETWQTETPFKLTQLVIGYNKS
jgi:hypothetical protein